MDSIISSESAIHFNDHGYEELNKYINECEPSCIFILVDGNTMQHCYPKFIPHLETTARIEVIEIDAGEEFKTIETCTGVWSALLELGCDRKSMMINLGGGVITDLGGFVASTIKRGIHFIHVPTTVLAMVDAAVGGKNGVDLGHLKNQIGVIETPAMTLIDTQYLKTLPLNHLHNGSIEMFKHGLIADRDYWKEMLAVSGDFYTSNFDRLINGSVKIKNEIVKHDPTEQGARKSLNYGHTIGHAIESFCLSSDEHPSLLHGEAIAIGLYLESFLSQEKLGLAASDFAEIERWYHSLKMKLNFSQEDIRQMLKFMTHDKKNVNGEIRFVLLEEIGKFKTDQTIPEEDLIAAFALLKD